MWEPLVCYAAHSVSALVFGDWKGKVKKNANNLYFIHIPVIHLSGLSRIAIESNCLVYYRYIWVLGAYETLAHMLLAV